MRTYLDSLKPYLVTGIILGIGYLLFGGLLISVSPKDSLWCGSPFVIILLWWLIGSGTNMVLADSRRKGFISTFLTAIAVIGLIISIHSIWWNDNGEKFWWDGIIGGFVMFLVFGGLATIYGFDSYEGNNAWNDHVKLRKSNEKLRENLSNPRSFETYQRIANEYRDYVISINYEGVPITVNSDCPHLIGEVTHMAEYSTPLLAFPNNNYEYLQLSIGVRLDGSIAGAQLHLSMTNISIPYY